jgi:hypothetical protein
MTALPMLGNLAWAPVPAIENVDVFDRFNGVPTLGLFSAAGERELFWRALGYVPRSMSIWFYLPVTQEDESHLSCADASDLLTGLIFRSQTARYVTVGIAKDYRLVFEREWHLPVDAPPDQLINDLLDFLNEALDIALEQDLPAARREIMRSASEAVKELAAC